jgi:peptidoglycan/LPS O-acetylase OafA/YrhL
VVFAHRAKVGSSVGAAVWLAVFALAVKLPVDAFRDDYLRFLAPVFALAAGAVIVGLVHAPLRAFGPLELPAAIYVGRRAYGIYLWHLPLFKFINEFGLGRWPTPVLLGVKLAATAVVAWLSFMIIEQPALRLRSRLIRAHGNTGDFTPVTSES